MTTEFDSSHALSSALWALRNMGNGNRKDAAWLAIVHAETAFEVHVSNLLLKIMTHYGMTAEEAGNLIGNDQEYWDVKNKIRHSG